MAEGCGAWPRRRRKSESQLGGEPPHLLACSGAVQNEPTVRSFLLYDRRHDYYSGHVSRHNVLVPVASTVIISRTCRIYEITERKYPYGSYLPIHPGLGLPDQKMIF